MHLYNLTLQRPTAITKAVVGNFSGSARQEILTTSGTHLELQHIDKETGKISLICQADVFGSIRSIVAFRLVGGKQDFIAVASDSGSIVILQFDSKVQNFIKVKDEPYGRSGVRRVVPGQYLAADPKGRALMISALEKAKLAYVLSRDDEAKLTISSPLDAHKENTIVYDFVALDVGWESPTFAALEFCTEASNEQGIPIFKKMLTYYEIDFNTNHVIERWSAQTDSRANLLVPIPDSLSTVFAPSGVLVCCEDHIIYKHAGVAEHRIPIPRARGSESGHGDIIVQAVVHTLKDYVLILVQSEEGHLFKVTIDHEAERVEALNIMYFDTVPVASSLCILKSGHLFVASELGNHHVYHIQDLGDDDTSSLVSSVSYPQFGMANPTTPLVRPDFTPRSLKNLVLVDEIQSLAPILDTKHLSTSSSEPMFGSACGRGARSSLRILQRGLHIEERASVAFPVTFRAERIWTYRTRVGDHTELESIIVFSFPNGTQVYSIGEELQEAKDTPLLTTSPTLDIVQMDEDLLVQVYNQGLRLVHGNGKVTEWPANEKIVAAASNTRQIAVALSSNELVYFELDAEGQLGEYQERMTFESEILALGLCQPLSGHQRFPFLIVGFRDQTVRILSVDPSSAFQILSIQALTSSPSAICITRGEKADLLSACILNIGMENGVMIQVSMDQTTGKLEDSRLRFLGTKPVALRKVQVDNNEAVVALSSRSWLQYHNDGVTELVPIISAIFTDATAFVTEGGTSDLVGLEDRFMRVVAFKDLNTKLKQSSISMTCTPRRIVPHPSNGLLYVIEGDHRMARNAGNEETQDDADATPNLTQAPAGNWVSSISVVDPDQMSIQASYALDNNESALSIAFVSFEASKEAIHLVVGTASDLVPSSQSYSAAFLRTYRLSDQNVLELVHKTSVDGLPLSLAAFQGRLVAGIGSTLRIFDMGKAKLLRKAESNRFPSQIVSLQCQGSRIVVGDMQQSVHFVTYKAQANQLITFADDIQARWVSTLTMVDYNTVAIGDRFGNIIVNRLDAQISEQVDQDPTGQSILQAKSTLMGAPYKTKLVAHFHVGDLITSIQKMSLTTGGPEVLVYTGLHGTIGVLIPVTSKDDVELLSTLEQHLRAEKGILVGRDHLGWRSYYAPVKGVVDGNLCNTFSKLSALKQRDISAQLDRSVGDLTKKLDQLRFHATGF